MNNRFIAGFFVSLIFAVPTRAADARREAEEEAKEKITALIQRTSRLATATERAQAALDLAELGTEPIGKTMKAIDDAIELIQQNVRYAGTPGYKSRKTQVLGDGTLQTYFDMEQAGFANTGRRLDIGISGQGFFAVKNKAAKKPAVLYTRNGNLFVNNKGELVLGLGDGYVFQPLVVISQNATQISISTDGVVQCMLPGKRVMETIGQLQIANFPSEEKLAFYEPCFFTETPASGPPTVCKPGENSTGSILSGYLEQSDVDLIKEYARLKFLTDWRDVLIATIRKPTTQP